MQNQPQVRSVTQPNADRGNDVSRISLIRHRRLASQSDSGKLDSRRGHPRWLTQGGHVVNQFQLQTLLLTRSPLYPNEDLSGTSRLGPDLARNIGAYPAYLPILLHLQEGRV